jgi:uncharacterized protein (DUF1501 family)
MIDRRRFLELSAAALGGLAFTAPHASARVLRRGPRARRGAPVLVLVQLGGGNDGLNTVVPFADPAYHAARKNLAIGERDVLPLSAGKRGRGAQPLGFPKELARLHRFFEEERLGVVLGAGYPDPNRSHFKSMDIWHTGDAAGRLSGPGWIGKLTAARHGESTDPNRLVHVGDELPYALNSSLHPAVAFRAPRRYRWAGDESELVDAGPRPMDSDGEGDNLDFLRGVQRDARASSAEVRGAMARYRPSVEYPDEPFAQSLAVAAALIASELHSEVISVQLTGFDTHNDQPNRHGRLMAELDAGLGLFLEDLRSQGLDEDVLVLGFSEFGRRVQENASRGTDHGTAGPMFLAGPLAKPGFHGEQPSLTDLDERGDLRHSVDFRTVYAAVLAGVFEVDPEAVLGRHWEPLDCVRRRT